MNINRIKKIGDEIIKRGVPMSQFANGEINLDKNKLKGTLLKNVKSLSEEDRSYLDLYIGVNCDQVLTDTRMMIRQEISMIDKKLDTIMESQEKQSKEIDKIKRVVGCNGE